MGSDVVNAHGGKREGAGRKPRPDGQGRTVPKSIKVSREVADYLSEHGTGIIEDMIRQSTKFKNWIKSNATVSDSRPPRQR